MWFIHLREALKLYTFPSQHIRILIKGGGDGLEIVAFRMSRRVHTCIDKAL